MRWLAIALALAACGKGGDKGGDKGDDKGAAPSGGGGRDAVLAAWKKGGLDASAFTPAPGVGKDCASGTVNKVEVVICTFGSPAEAKQAVDAGLQWVADSPTGSSQAKGSVVIAVRDRAKADPSGRTINQIFKLAP